MDPGKTLIALALLLTGCAATKLSFEQQRVLDAFNSCKEPGSTAHLVFRGNGFVIQDVGAVAVTSGLQRIKACMTEHWGVQWVN